jgi:2-dehydro-3-deoxygluconokinase
MPGLQVLDRIGSGDAFAAGLIHGLLNDVGLCH